MVLNRYGRPLNGTILGPMEEGDDIMLTCRVIGGKHLVGNFGPGGTGTMTGMMQIILGFSEGGEWNCIQSALTGMFVYIHNGIIINTNMNVIGSTLSRHSGSNKVAWCHLLEIQHNNSLVQLGHAVIITIVEKYW